MVVNFEKCDFVRTSLKYLGHMVTSEGICTDPEKIEAMQKLPTPTNIKELRRVLGTASWYRRFVPNFSDLVAPMNSLLKKTTKWEWGVAQEDAFAKLKDKLTQTPVLGCPNYDFPFFLHTDASKAGLGAVLFQRQADGKSRNAATRSLSRF